MATLSTAGLLVDKMTDHVSAGESCHPLVIQGNSGTEFTLRMFRIDGSEMPSLACTLDSDVPFVIMEELFKVDAETLGSNHTAWAATNHSHVQSIAGIVITAVGGTGATFGMTAQNANHPFLDGASWTKGSNHTDVLVDDLTFGQVPVFF